MVYLARVCSKPQNSEKAMKITLKKFDIPCQGVHNRKINICMWLYLLHIFLLSMLFISFYPFEMNVVKRWNSDEDNSAEVWYPLPGCVHNRKIGSGAGCEARRWKFMNNEGGLSLPQVPNLTFPWFGNGETEVKWECMMYRRQRSTCTYVKIWMWIK